MGVPYWAWAGVSWVTIAIIGGIFQGASIDPSSLDTVLNMKVITIMDVGFFGASFQMPMPNMGFFAALTDLLSFDFEMFTGDMNVVRIFLLAVLAGPVVYIFLQTVAPTILQAIATLRRMSPL